MKTIIGYFDDRSQASLAIDRLVSDNLISRDEARLIDHSHMSESLGSSTRQDRTLSHDSERSGVSGFFSDLFGSSHDNRDTSSYDYYAEGLRRGDVLVCVDVEDNEADRVADSLDMMGATNIDRRAEYLRSSGFERFNDSSSAPYSPDETNHYRSDYREWESKNYSDMEDEKTIPVIEEELRVGKREVSRGGVKVFTRVTERPVEEEITLRDEEISVERRPVNRSFDKSNLDTNSNAFEETEFEMSETDEEAVVSKEAKVVEEVAIKKTAKQRKETIRETLRRQDVEVEERGDREERDTDRLL